MSTKFTGAIEGFTVSKGVLRANADMYWECLEEFDSACDRLLKSHKSKLEVDLTRVNFVSSSFLGCLGDVIVKASRMKKHIVVKVTLNISWLFDIMGGVEILEIVLV